MYWPEPSERECHADDKTVASPQSYHQDNNRWTQNLSGYVEDEPSGMYSYAKEDYFTDNEDMMHLSQSPKLFQIVYEKLSPDHGRVDTSG